MLTKLDVFNTELNPSQLILDENGSANTDPLQIRQITGLDPVPAAIATQKFAQIDGEFFTGASVSKRNIVLTIGLNPNWVDQSMEGLRQILYGYFMPKFQTKLRFYSTHLPTVEIVGYVESFEENIFSKDPEIQVSIVCPQPDFVAVEPTVISGNVEVESDFTLTRIDYSGTVTTGFNIEIENLDTRFVAYTGMFHVITQTLVQSVFSFNGVAGRDIEGVNYRSCMSSVPGDKRVYTVNENGVITNQLRSVSLDANWPILHQGRNQIAVLSDSAMAEGVWELSYFSRFGGL